MLQTPRLNAKPTNELRNTPQVTTLRNRRENVPTEITEEQIRVRAYEIYLARGAEAGHEAEDWVKAEQELRNGNRP